MNPQEPQFVTKRGLSEAIGLSADTFKAYRLNDMWQRGIHWQMLNSRMVVYNLPLILDWFANQDDPAAHQRAIEDYLASLPSNQPGKPGRKAKTPKSAA